MGNCWRMPEDHSGLLHVPATNFASIPTSSSNSYLTFTSPISTTSDTHIPKVISTLLIVFPIILLFQLVTLSRSAADLNVIKAAQCQNVVEHLPLINYNEKTVKQTE